MFAQILTSKQTITRYYAISPSPPGMVRYGGPSSAAACGCLPSSNLHGKLPGTGGGAVKGDGEYCLTYGEKGSRTVREFFPLNC